MIDPETIQPIIQPTIDLGQIVISIFLLLISVIGWFVKRDIETLSDRIDKHDVKLFELATSVNRLIGRYEADSERREHARREHDSKR